MNRSSRIAVAIGAIAFAFGATAPVLAQYANEYVPPKLISKGSTAHVIAGSGKVIVQVQVNADGTHKAIKVIKSTNPGDNAAAMDIAQNSSYRPASKGGKKLTAFYDYTLKFIGKSVAADTGGASPAVAIDRMIRAGNYAGAKAAASQYLLSSPGDSNARALLGIADFYASDFESAAAAFALVPTIDKKYQPVAAHAFASAAVSIAPKNPTLAVSYGQKALALENSANSLFSLGVAQLASNDLTDATANLKKARDRAFADPKTDTKSKVNLDSALLQAYLKANDSADAQTVAAEIKQLDPTSTVPGRVMGSAMLQAGLDARKAKQHDVAIKDFEAAAAAGDPQLAVTANAQAAFEIAGMDKPDYNKMKAYADKALAIKADDPGANYAEGIAYTGLYVSSKKDDLKKQALDYCTKAAQYARAQGNEAMALQIETFVKNNLK
jgi:TonB family protein